MTLIPGTEANGPSCAVYSPSSRTGRQLGAYRINSVLGDGGMGEVCRV